MKVDDSEITGFAVQPKLDCPHLTEELAAKITTYLEGLKEKITELKCHTCEDHSENWICLTCDEIACSRYVKGHMAEHNQITKHSIALSFSDGSYWCYDCESYIDSHYLRKARFALSKKKTDEEAGKEATEQEKASNKEAQKLAELFAALDVKENKKKTTLNEVVDGIKDKKYKKVVVLTGAGLSVAAGIPDFRSPGTGLYSKLQEYKLPYPEAIFSIDYFEKEPTAFLGLAKELLTKDFEPTLGHKFIKKLQDEEILLMNLTQNIDDLQIKAGVHEEKLLQAHGHSRSAHCIGCKKQANIEAWKKEATELKAMRCECGGLVKPDIVFFGEQLPAKFFQAPKIVGECDLAIIIGTSLKVMPFAFLAQLIPETAPIILINRENVLEEKPNTIWMNGDIQENVAKIMGDLKWL